MSDTTNDAPAYPIEQTFSLSIHEVIALIHVATSPFCVEVPTATRGRLINFGLIRDDDGWLVATELGDQIISDCSVFKVERERPEDLSTYDFGEQLNEFIIGLVASETLELPPQKAALA